jgi:hypothetical protein
MPVEQHGPAKVAVAVNGVGETGLYHWNAVDDQTRRRRYDGALRQETRTHPEELQGEQLLFEAHG